jgi:hypothetical protein
MTPQQFIKKSFDCGAKYNKPVMMRQQQNKLAMTPNLDKLAMTPQYNNETS